MSLEKLGHPSYLVSVHRNSHQSLSFDSQMALPFALQSISTREAIADAVYRAVQGIDTNDLPLFKSALTEDVSMEATGMGVIQADDIVNKMFSGVGPMDTTHIISNIRINAEEDGHTASMTAYAVAQHFRKGEGHDPAAPGLLSGGIYTLELVKDSKDGLWKVRKWVVDFKWMQGDRSIMTWQQ